MFVPTSLPIFGYTPLAGFLAGFVPIYLAVLIETELALCNVLYSHLEGATNRHEIRFLIALYMTALRVALEEWLEQEVQGDLVSLLCGYLDSFSSLSQQA